MLTLVIMFSTEQLFTFVNSIPVSSSCHDFPLERHIRHIVIKQEIMQKHVNSVFNQNFSQNYKSAQNTLINKKKIIV